MNCFDCHPAAASAVAVCVLCGKAVCHDHCVRQTLRVHERVPSGMAAQVVATGRQVPRMLCRECAVGLGGRAVSRIEVRREG
jgi:hypothetical protein